MSHRRQLTARLTILSGPARSQHICRSGAQVMAVACRYCVTYLILGRNVVVAVDVGSIGDVSQILEALWGLGRPASQLRFVVPTHLHFDHVMGIDALAQRAGASILLSRTAWQHVTEGRPLRFPSWRRNWRSLLTWPMQGMPFLPAVDWMHGLDFGFPWGHDRFTAPLGPILDHESTIPGLDGWTVLLTPGHSDDSLCLFHAEAGLLIAGDTIRNFYGGEWNPLVVDEDDSASSRALLSELEVCAVLPGHGPVVQGDSLCRGLIDVPRFLP